MRTHEKGKTWTLWKYRWASIRNLCEISFKYSSSLQIASRVWKCDSPGFRNQNNFFLISHYISGASFMCHSLYMLIVELIYPSLVNFSLEIEINLLLSNWRDRVEKNGKSLKEKNEEKIAASRSGLHFVNHIRVIQKSEWLKKVQVTTLLYCLLVSSGG